jgi:hypothetical protein
LRGRFYGKKGQEGQEGAKSFDSLFAPSCPSCPFLFFKKPSQLRADRKMNWPRPGGGRRANLKSQISDLRFIAPLFFASYCRAIHRDLSFAA